MPWFYTVLTGSRDVRCLGRQSARVVAQGTGLQDKGTPITHRGKSYDWSSAGLTMYSRCPTRTELAPARISEPAVAASKASCGLPM